MIACWTGYLTNSAIIASHFDRISKTIPHLSHFTFGSLIFGRYQTFGYGLLLIRTSTLWLNITRFL
jgi:hypothetical protein